MGAESQPMLVLGAAAGAAFTVQLVITVIGLRALVDGRDVIWQIGYRLPQIPSGRAELRALVHNGTFAGVWTFARTCISIGVVSTLPGRLWDNARKTFTPPRLIDRGIANRAAARHYLTMGERIRAREAARRQTA